MGSRALMLAGAGALAIAGCGSDGSGVAETVTVVKTTAAPASAAPVIDARADRALARRALLRLSDLPVGWTATEDESSPIDCRAFRSANELPHANTLRFEHGDEEFVSQRVALYATPEDVDAAIDDFLAADTRNCLGDHIETHLADRTQGARIDDVTVSELNVEPLGQRSSAFRAHVALSVNGVDADVYADYVFCQVGRGLTTLLVGSPYTEPDEELQATLARRAVVRLGEALGRA